MSEYEEIRNSLDEIIRESDRASLYTDLVKLIIRISDYIFEKSEKAREGVETIMSGQVLELQSEKDQRISRKIGRKSGQDQILSLSHIMISQGRYADLNKATLDPDYCQQLLEEYHLTDESDDE